MSVQVYRFNDCEVDAARREMTVKGRLVDVQPLIFDLLVYLLDNANRVVSKEQMLRAVWRSAVMSDSVVARAVMKLRRAIGDDAAQARTVLTAHRVGYRLVAQVQRIDRPELLPEVQFHPGAEPVAPVPRHGLALTRFDNRSGDAHLDALLPELDHMLAHLLGDWPGRAAVGSPQAHCAWQAAQGEPDPFRAACEHLQVAELAVLSVLRAAGQYTVHVVRGPAAELAVTTTFSGTNLLVLAGRVAELLCGGGSLADTAARDDQGFWQGQYARALKLHHQGVHGQARELLQLCRWHLSTSVPMGLVHGRLLLATGDLAQAAEQFEAARQGAIDAGRADLELEAQLACAELAIAQGQTQAGVMACERALALVRALPTLAADAPRVMVRLVQVLVAAGRGPEAIQLAERAISIAQRLGHRAAEQEARVELGRTLVVFRQFHRAAEALRRVLDAESGALPGACLGAHLALAEVEAAQHRHRASAEHARQARVLARQVDPAQALRAQALELDGLLNAGETGPAWRLLQQHRVADGVLDGAAPAWVRRAQALLHWREGQAELAKANLAALLAEPVAQANRSLRISLACELCFMWLAERQLAPLAALRPQLEDADPWLLARVEAATALCQGDRPLARQVLMAAWTGAGANAWDGFEVGVDLAWLLLEDGDHEPLERVIAQVMETTAEPGPARLLQQAYLGATAAPDRRIADWARAVAEFPSLMRRHPHLAADDPTATSRRLSELLTRACM